VNKGSVCAQNIVVQTAVSVQNVTGVPKNKSECNPVFIDKPNMHTHAQYFVSSCVTPRVIPM
jgi:hypothetical protein